ncbi:MAG: Inorganic pyrophosphatase/exopolyphosphatase [Parcubacteria bacterium 32_520]|nr:MAG: Inorganic pyrophosphatase/exopolyphosphatase [Parcubacteria bacterium 32_520]
MNQEETIYIVGHKSPDTDAVCSAIAYSEYLKHKGIKAVPTICGELNPETKYVLEYFNVEEPISMCSTENRRVILVDYNEDSQGFAGLENARVVEVIDHHKIGFSSSNPIRFEIRPYGSTATIIAKKMFNNATFEITKPIAGILLSAILSDTVIFKSSTTTSMDVKIAEELSKIAEIEDVERFGIELKKKKSSLSGMTGEQIINADFKTFEVGNNSFGIGQVEVVDLSEAKQRKAELIEELNKIKQKDNLLFVILMVTDIINEGSELLLSDGHELISFNGEVKNNSIYIEGMMSRKKDLVPQIMESIK